MKKEIDWSWRISICVVAIAVCVVAIAVCARLYRANSADEPITSEWLNGERVERVWLDKPVKEVSRDIFRSISEMPFAKLILWCIVIFIVIYLIVGPHKRLGGNDENKTEA